MKNTLLIIHLISLSFLVKGQTVMIPSSNDSKILANLNRGLTYMKGNDSLAIDYKEAVKYLKLAATENEHVAQFFLGKIYEVGGYGIDANRSKAFEFYLKSAQNGSPEAMVYYSLLLMKSEGTETNFKEGYKMFKKAAEQNNLNGIYSMGYMHFKGLGVEQDYSISFPLFYEAAGKQHIPSIHILGYSYENGLGVEQSLENAIHCYEFSAGQGYEQSIIRLEELNESGLKSVSLVKESLNHEFEEKMLIPEKCKINTPLSPCKQPKLSGEWEGVFYSYDWSMNKILEKQAISINIQKIDNYFQLTIDADHTHTTGEMYHDDSRYYFDNLDLIIKDPFGDYASQTFKDMKLMLDTIDGEIYLTGKIETFINEHQEPGNPAILMLKLINTSTETATNIEVKKQVPLDFTAYPNPFKDELNIHFSLEEAQNITIDLYQLNGKRAKSLINNEYLLEGNYSYSFNEDIPNGIYIIDFTYGKTKHIQRIIKN